jgi:pyruvate dehydrogenase (quinone)
LNADRPVVLEACTDPDVPPLPPQATWKQAKSYASAIMKGDSESAGIIRETVKQIFA